MPLFSRKNKNPQAQAAEVTPEPLHLYGHTLPAAHLAIVAEEAHAGAVLGELLRDAKGQGRPTAALLRKDNAVLQGLCTELGLTDYTLDDGFTHTQLRELMAERLSHPQDGKVLVLGRKLGILWPTILNTLKGPLGPIRVLADVSLQTKLPLPLLFRHFLVDQDNEELFEQAVERWHRHEATQPNYSKRWLGGGISLYTRQ